jgi:hypothetical protein
MRDAMVQVFGESVIWRYAKFEGASLNAAGFERSRMNVDEPRNRDRQNAAGV